MARLSWHKRNHEQSLATLSELSMDERAVLPYLIDLMHATEDNVEDNDKVVAHRLWLDVRRWRKVKASLLAGGWIYIDNGIVRNRDVSNSIAVAMTACKLLSDRNREAGVKSGAVRREISRLAEQGVQHDVEQIEIENKKEKEGLEREEEYTTYNPQPIDTYSDLEAESTRARADEAIPAAEASPELAPQVAEPGGNWYLGPVLSETPEDERLAHEERKRAALEELRAYKALRSKQSAYNGSDYTPAGVPIATGNGSSMICGASDHVPF